MNESNFKIKRAYSANPKNIHRKALKLTENRISTEIIKSSITLQKNSKHMISLFTPHLKYSLSQINQTRVSTAASFNSNFIFPNSLNSVPIIDINNSIKKKQIETIQSQYAQTEENLKTSHSPYFKIEKSVDFNIKPSILKKSISPFLTKQQQKYNKSYFFQKIDFWKLGFLAKHPLINEENNSKNKLFKFEIINNIFEQVLEKCTNDKTLNELYELKKGLEKNFSFISEIINEIIISLKSLENPLLFYEKFEKIVENVHSFNNIFLYLVIAFLNARIYYSYKDYLKAITLLKSIHIIAEKYKMNHIIALCFQFIGLSYKNIKIFNLALKYFLEYLRFSWLIKDKSNELLAYDNIGLLYFNMGNIDRAKYYHNRSMKGIYEADDSLYKLHSNTKLIKQRLELEEENENEKSFRKSSIEILSQNKISKIEKDDIIDEIFDDIEVKENGPKDNKNYYMNIIFKKTKKINQNDNGKKIGEFFYKNEEFFNKRKKKFNPNRLKEFNFIGNFNSKCYLMHRSCNRNDDNYQGFIYDNDFNNGSSNLLKLSYQPNNLNEQKIKKLTLSFVEILETVFQELNELIKYLKNNS